MPVSFNFATQYMLHHIPEYIYVYLNMWFVVSCCEGYD